MHAMFCLVSDFCPFWTERPSVALTLAPACAKVQYMSTPPCYTISSTVAAFCQMVVAIVGVYNTSNLNINTFSCSALDIFTFSQRS